MCKRKLLVAIFGVCISVGLVACGSDSSSSSGSGLGGLGGSSSSDGSGTGTTATGSSSSSAHTIVLTYPITDSIENVGGGVYRRTARAIVTDNEGNPVPDGTRVYLNVIDSVLAQGTITTVDGDSINGAVLTDANPMLGDGSTATSFDTAYVVRNEAYHFIEPEDHVLLASNPAGAANADPEDKNRVISTASGSIAATALTVSADYENSYPNAIYPTATTDYVVGVSSLGAEVLGEDADGNLLNEGYSTTTNGVATFYITYPATINTIRTGCLIPADDQRSLPAGSGRVYLVASAGTKATTVDQRFCFASIAPWTITAYPAVSEISATNSLSFEVRDGGNTVNLPYSYVIGSVAVTKNTGGLTVTLDNPLGMGSGVYRTDSSGWFDSTITVAGGASGDEATVTYSAGDTTTEIKVVIP